MLRDLPRDIPRVISIKLASAHIVIMRRHSGAARRLVWIVLVIIHRMFTACGRPVRTRFLLLLEMLPQEENDQAKSEDNGNTADGDAGDRTA